MKKSLLAATVALSCICTLGLAGCGGGATNTNANNTNSNTTAAVSTGNSNTNGNSSSTSGSSSRLGDSGSTSTSTSTSTSSTTSSSSSASGDAGTPEAAIEKATDEGVTKLSFDQMQDLMDNTLNVGMTLSDVRSAMGGVNGTLMGDGYDANTFAWYTADKGNAIIATFTSQDGSGTLTSCQIGID